ncbi:hypothetical protein CVE27_18720, partial [Pseudomonas syringae pv. actinidiae]|nr:hypothetical protein [Pseudomonas syringae pv. actinidiae]
MGVAAAWFGRRRGQTRLSRPRRFACPRSLGFRRSGLVREGCSPDAENASTAPPSSRTSEASPGPLPPKLVDTCRSGLVRELP